MKIGFLGNVCNNSYTLAKLLREAGLDVHLHVCETDPITCQPGSDGAVPDWVHVGRYYSKQAFRYPWASTIAQELKQYDLTFVCGNGPIFSQWTGKPSIFFATGGEFTVLPFPFKFRSYARSWKHFRNNCIKAFWQRLGLLRMKKVYGYGFSPFQKAARRIGVKLETQYLPIVFDLDLFQEPQPWPEAVQALRDQWRFILFHPTRMMIKQTPQLIDSGQIKRNDLLIEGFAHFLRENNIQDAVMVIPDTDLSVDIQQARDLVSQLGIERNVVWLKSKDGKAFPRKAFIPYYQACDVVADDFGIGWFGSVVCEGFACAKPVISYVDETVMRQLYPWHPILSSREPVAIGNYLRALYQDEAYRTECGTRGQAWVHAFHSAEAGMQEYVRIFKELLPIEVTDDCAPAEIDQRHSLTGV